MTGKERFQAILRLRCPICGAGRVFSGTFAMPECCPACGLKFQREPGYFLGAMYFSYALAIPIIFVLTVIAYLLLPHRHLYEHVLLAWVAFLPFVPAVYRYSRVMWIHFDRYFDPE